MDAIGRTLALAARQHHVVAVAQASELGLSPDSFAKLRRRQGWVRWHRGVWSPPGTAPTGLTRLSALLLAAGPNAVVTGASGLWLRGMVEVEPSPRLVVPADATVARHLDARIIRTDAPFARERVQRLATADVATCLGDLCRPPAASPDVVRDLAIAAVQQRLATMADLEAVVDRPRRPGAPLLRRVLAELATSGADSPLVHRVHVRLRRSGRRPDRRPVVVAVRDRDLHPDITFADHRIAIEVDGLRFHRTSRALSLDHAKDRAYLAAGWHVLRLSWWDVTHAWSRFLAELDRLLAA